MVNEIKLKITIDGKDATASLKLTDDNLKSIIKSVKSANISTKGLSETITSGFEKAKHTLEGFREVMNHFKDTLQAPLNTFLQFGQAQRKLEATAKLTGIEFEKLKTASNEVQNQYKLTSIQANEFTISLSKLGSKAGDISQTSDAIGKLLDLSAAQGLSAEEALLSIQQAIIGIDEGTDKLFQKNPSVIYKEYGKQIGISAAKMSDMQKAQALMNELLTQGSKVSGEYNKKLSDTVGAIEQFNNQWDIYKAKAGQIIAEAVTPLLFGLTEMMKMLDEFSPLLAKLVSITGVLTVSLGMLNTVGLMPLIFKMPTMIAALETAKVQFHLASMSGLKFAGSMRAASISIRGFFAALGPIGWATLAVGALATGFSLLSSNTEESKKQMSEEEKQLRNQQAEFKKLTSVLKDTKKPMDERKTALKQINEKYPDYLKNINLEKIKYDELTAAIDKANAQYERQIRAKITLADYEAKIAQLRELETKEQEVLSKWQTAPDANIAVFNPKEAFATEYRKVVDKKAELRKEIDTLFAEYSKLKNAEDKKNNGGGKKDYIKELTKQYETLIEILILEGRFKEAEATRIEYLSRINTLLDKGKLSQEQRLTLLKTQKEVMSDLEYIERDINQEIENVKLKPLKLPVELQKVDEVEKPNYLQQIEDDLDKQFQVAKMGFQSLANVGQRHLTNMWSNVFGQGKSFLQQFLIDFMSQISQLATQKLAMGLFGMLFPSGGIFKMLGMADGGYVSGEGGERDDKIPAMLSNGEYVINAQATKQFRPLLEAINYRKYATGGYVSPLANAPQTNRTVVETHVHLKPSVKTKYRDLSIGLEREKEFRSKYA